MSRDLMNIPDGSRIIKPFFKCVILIEYIRVFSFFSYMIVCSWSIFSSASPDVEE